MSSQPSLAPLQALAVEMARDACLFARADGVIVAANPACEALLGRPTQELLGRGVAELSPELMPLLGRDGKAPHLLKLLRRDGSELPCEALVRRVGVDGANYLVLQLRDLRERRGLERRLMVAQRQALSGELAAGAVHDFNNLLTVVMSHAIWLAETLPEGTPGRAALDQIMMASRRASSLALRLIKASRRRAMRTERLELRRVLREVSQWLPQVVGSGIAIQIEACAEPCEVTADPALAEQVLLNLALNAWQAMQGEGILRFELRCVDERAAGRPPRLSPGDFVTLAVRDSGSGIPEAALGRVFDPYFTTREDGNGLGLSVCRTIVREAGGDIAVDSQLGAGSCFTVWLPRVCA